MKILEKLLNGKKVQWKTLGEVAELKRGTSITKKTSNEGNFPVISGGQQPAYYIDQAGGFSSDAKKSRTYN